MLHIIWNPTAGNRRAARVKAEIEAILIEKGVEYCFHCTSQRGDAARFAGELSEIADCDIVALGGDGTLHEVLNGLRDPGRVKLGVIPCGSGNDLCKGVGIPLDPIRALELILTAHPKPTDYMLCSGVRSLNVLGAGIDVEVLRYCYQSPFPKGSLNYFVSLLRALLHFRFCHFRMHRDGVTDEHDSVIACVCNGRYFGGGIAICPDADCADGMLNVVTVEGLRKRELPSALLRLMQGNILTCRCTKHVKGMHIRVETDRPTTIQIDGELYDNLPFDVSVVPCGLLLYRP